eukprot:2932467-Rhodomonas_salina.1
MGGWKRVREDERMREDESTGGAVREEGRKRRDTAIARGWKEREGERSGEKEREGERRREKRREGERRRAKERRAGRRAGRRGTRASRREGSWSSSAPSPPASL